MQELNVLLEKAKCLASTLNHEWLDEIGEDLQHDNINVAYVAPYLRGFVRCLHAAKQIPDEDLYDFENLYFQVTGLFVINNIIK